MSRVTVPVPQPGLLLVPRERLREAGPVAGVLNVLRTHSQPCHSDHSPYLANSGPVPSTANSTPLRVLEKCSPEDFSCKKPASGYGNPF